MNPESQRDPNLAARVTNDLLHWLSEASSDAAEVRSRLEGIPEAHPNLRPSSHPELLSGMESGVVGSPPSPVDANELARREVVVAATKSQPRREGKRPNDGAKHLHAV